MKNIIKKTFQPTVSNLTLNSCSVFVFGAYCEMSRQETIALKSVRLWSGQNYMCSSSTDDPMLRLCRQFTQRTHSKNERDKATQFICLYHALFVSDIARLRRPAVVQFFSTLLYFNGHMFFKVANPLAKRQKPLIKAF